MGGSDSFSLGKTLRVFISSKLSGGAAGPWTAFLKSKVLLSFDVDEDTARDYFSHFTYVGTEG